jgi:hypothetical protein
MPKRSIRRTDAIDQRIQSAAKLRGYSTPTAFLRAAIKKELNEPGEGSAGNEKILGYIREVRQDVRRVERAQQALFALVDSFGKVFVTCVPEPRGEAMQTALAEARNRYARLLTNASHAMLSDSMAAMEDLIGRGGKISMRSVSSGFGQRSRQRAVNASLRVRVSRHHASRPDERSTKAPPDFPTR